MSRARRVSFAQMEQLWEMLNGHKDIALGYNKSLQAREYARRFWEEAATSLNSQGDGASKDGKGWSKYWVDYKSKIKKIAGALRLSQRRTGGGPAETKPPSDIEAKFLAILGSDFGSGLPGGQIEPFLEEEELHNNIEEETVSMSILDAPTSPPAEAPTVPVETLLLHPTLTEATLPPDCSPTADPLLTVEHPISQSAHSSMQPSNTPNHRRRRLRRTVMTSEESRNALIKTSDRRAEIKEQRNAILDVGLQALTDAILELNEILKSM